MMGLVFLTKQHARPLLSAYEKYVTWKKRGKKEEYKIYMKQERIAELE